MKRKYQITIYKNFGLREKIKISSEKCIEKLIEDIREQCNGNLLTFRNSKNEIINLDRNIVDKFIVKEVNK